MKKLLRKIYSVSFEEKDGYKTTTILGIKFNKKINNLTNEMDLLKKSYYYILTEKLFDRDINKNFDMSFTEQKDIFHSADWSNLSYMINCKNFSFGNVLNIDYIPDVIIKSGFGGSDLNSAILAQIHNIPYLISEDGFLSRAVTWLHQGCDEKYIKNISYVLDNLAPYFDATRPSLLENMLNDKNLVLTEEQIERAKNLIKKITENHLTKYNHQPIFTPNIGTHNKKVLVVDQSYGDMSIGRGMANDRTFENMLKSAIKENPDADIIVKTHPDTMTGKRGGYYTGLKAHDNIYTMTDPINPISMINYVDKVYVCTTQLGFEALMCGKEVHIFGMPFYAGWGLANERQTLSRRTNKRTLEEVFYITYIMYTRYFNPYTKQPCEIEDAIDCLLKLREEYKTYKEVKNENI